MAGPWEDYQAAPAAAGPWNEYAPAMREPSVFSDPLGAIKADIKGVPGRIGNMLAGSVKGASQIGATLLAPYDMTMDALDGKGVSLESNRQRRADVTGVLQGLGADPNSAQFKGGEIGTEILGTLGVGNVLSAGVRALPFAGKGIDAVATALRTGGFRTGDPALPFAQNWATRIGSGSAVGGASAGLVDPEQAGTGAKIGAALPPVAKVAGEAAQVVANLWSKAKTPQDFKIAQQLAQQLGVTAEDLKAVITGPQMIPGYQQTVPQIVQNPVASQLQRTLQTAGRQDLADAAKMQQGQFRDALGQVAPLGTTVQDSANRAGSAIQSFAVPAERAAGQNVNQLFDAIPSGTAMQLPLQQMQTAQTRFLGPGTFGKGGAAAEQAMGTATNIGMDAATMTPRAVPFSQIQALRSSIGEAIADATKNGRNQAAAALTNMKNAIDNKVADVAAGNALPGEVFTPQAVDSWGQALNAHAAKKLQFNTGPQVGMFRQGADGQPAMQGAEIPGEFFNGNRSQVEDMQAFKRLIGDDPAGLAKELKSFALTEGANTATAGGNLGDSFINWAKGRSGAIGQLFSPQEQLTIREVGKAVQRQMAAENLGRVSGPDTAQKLAALQSNGLLDNKLVDGLANKIPGLGRFTGPMLGALRASANQQRAGIQSGLLADPARFAAALEQQRLGSGLLNFTPEPSLLTRGFYRSAPLLGVSQ